MEEKVLHSKEQFYEIIESAAEKNTWELLAFHDSEMQLFSDSVEGFLYKKREKVRKFLGESNYRAFFSLHGIESDLAGCLDRYYNFISMLLTSGMDYKKSPIYKHYAIDSTDGMLTGDSFKWLHGREGGFEISNHVDVKTLSLYIAKGRLFLELNRQCAQFQKEKIFLMEKNLPEKIYRVEKSSEDLMAENLNQSSSPTKVTRIFKEGAYDLFSYLRSE